MARSIWKGAISFGLVHVPVALFPATQSDGVDFDWLDRRTLDPVGYKRVNKRTGKEIKKEDIVKGVQQADGDYVVLSDKEVAEAYPRTTQTIAIEAFVKAQEVSFVYLERPYYLESINKGDKVYVLLRDAMAKAGVIGIARLVLHTKEHLAALVPAGPALMLDLLRWSDDIRSGEELNIPGESAAKPKEAELKMATQLIEEMTTEWRPDAYKDTFSNAVRKLIEKKVAAGETARIEPLEEVNTGGASNVIDLAELLRGSLKRGQDGSRNHAAKDATENVAQGDAKQSGNSGKEVKKAVNKEAREATRTTTKTAPKSSTKAPKNSARKPPLKKAATSASAKAAAGKPALKRA